jgi:small Trp-rich protein
MVLVGVLLLVAWWADFGPFGRLPWWAIALPFVIAVLWWEFADSSGWTQRRVMDKLEKRKSDRRQKAMDALGLNHRRERQVTKSREEAARRTTTADPTQRDDS